MCEYVYVYNIYFIYIYCIGSRRSIWGKKEIEIRIIARTRVAKTDYCVGGDKGRWPGTAAAAAAVADHIFVQWALSIGQEKASCPRRDTHLQDEPLGVEDAGRRQRRVGERWWV